MKVKLYRGPAHGKTINIPPDSTDVIMAVVKRGDFRATFWTNSPAVSIPYTNARYVMKMMGCTHRGTSFYAPSMHPDGSFIFEWDGSK